MKNAIIILGIEYSIKESSTKVDAKLINNNAYTDLTTKEIVYEPLNQTLETMANLDAYQKKVLRHEVIHAFFSESGLHSRYGSDETLVDWIAVQLPKLFKACKEIDILEGETE